MSSTRSPFRTFAIQAQQRREKNEVRIIPDGVQRDNYDMALGYLKKAGLHVPKGLSYESYKLETKLRDSLKEVNLLEPSSAAPQKETEIDELAEGLALYMAKLELAEWKIICKNFLIKQSTLPDIEPASGATTDNNISLIGSPDRKNTVNAVDSCVRMQTFGQQASPSTKASAVQTELFIQLDVKPTALKDSSPTEEILSAVEEPRQPVRTPFAADVVNAPTPTAES